MWLCQWPPHCIGVTLECVNFLDKRSHGDNIVLKMDVRKTFDTLDWGFLLEVLSNFGFCSHNYEWFSSKIHQGVAISFFTTLLKARNSHSPQIQDLILIGIINIIWFIWFSRNKLRFQNIKLPVSTIKACVVSAVSPTASLSKGSMFPPMQEFIVLQEFSVVGHPRKDPYPKPVIWRPPCHGWMKVNLDGSSLGSLAISGVGGIFRDCYDVFQGAFALNIGLDTTFHAEIIAAMKAHGALPGSWLALFVAGNRFYASDLCLLQP